MGVFRKEDLGPGPIERAIAFSFGWAIKEVDGVDEIDWAVLVPATVTLAIAGVFLMLIAPSPEITFGALLVLVIVLLLGLDIEGYYRGRQ